MQGNPSPVTGPLQQMKWLWNFIIHHPPVMYGLIGFAVVVALFWLLKRMAGKPLRDLEKKAQGDMAVAAHLGDMYRNGEEGAPLDYRKAAYWYRRAAEAGNADGQAGLGALYYMGQGMRQDYAAAAEWNHRAALQGHAHGQGYLGLLYFKGYGTPKNPSEAYFWIVLAMAPREKGQASMASMPSFVTFAKEVSQSLSPTERETLKQRAKDWKPGDAAPAVTPAKAGNWPPA
ncbi:MAG: tetratricopeptide repeat protein [Alphaproteobacteria bacterium]